MMKYLKNVSILLLVFCQAIVAQDQFVFVPNAGQWDDRVAYKCELEGGAVFMENDGLTFSFYDPEFFHNIHEGVQDSVLKFHAFKMEFQGANPAVKMRLTQRTSCI